MLSLVSASYYDSDSSMNAQASASAGTNANSNSNSASASSNASADAQSNSGSETETKNSVLHIQISPAQIKARVKTQINFSDNVNEDGSLRVQLSNGRYASIRVLPETASATAQARINASCEENNCTLELKEVGSGNDVKLVYEVESNKDAKFLWLFKAKAKVKVQVDAETGEVVRIDKPWWASIKEDTTVNSKTEASSSSGY